MQEDVEEATSFLTTDYLHFRLLIFFRLKQVTWLVIVHYVGKSLWTPDYYTLMWFFNLIVIRAQGDESGAQMFCPYCVDIENCSDVKMTACFYGY